MLRLPARRGVMVGWDDLRREPYRALFPLGTLFGILGVSHWLLYALQWAPTSSSFYHASVQISAYLYCFVAGFLLTALPRFAAAPPASSGELLAVLGLLGAQLLFLCLGSWVAAEACFAALLTLLAAFAGRRFLRRHASVAPPTELIWVPMAIGLGLCGMLLLGLAQLGVGPSWCFGVGRPMVQQGFAVGIVLGVGGFMAPRLMGSPAFVAVPPGVSAAQAGRMRRRRLQWHRLAGLAFFISFWIEGTGALRPAYLLRAVVVTAELAWTTRFYRAPTIPDGYVKLLRISLWLIVLGFWGAGLWPLRRIMMLHLVFLGGISLMLFAVGTMVVLSHAGEGRRLREPLWVVRVVGVGVGGAVVARELADLLPAFYMPLLGLAAASWLAAGVSWLGAILPKVLVVPPAAVVEQLHEEAKQRVRQHA